METIVLEDGSVIRPNRPPKTTNELGRRLNQALERIMDLEEQVRLLKAHVELIETRRAA